VGRVFLAGEPLGTAEAALDASIEHARNCRQVG
jgi:alkylation response protein AidB-like acyl-CoA dehydrogenase